MLPAVRGVHEGVNDDHKEAEGANFSVLGARHVSCLREGAALRDNFLLAAAVEVSQLCVQIRVKLKFNGLSNNNSVVCEVKCVFEVNKSRGK